MHRHLLLWSNELMASEDSKSSRPWYRRFREEFLLASRWMTVFESNRAGEISRETISVFEQEMLTRFIFESNNIEKEGLSLGETRELILSELVDNPDFVEWRDLIVGVAKNLGAHMRDWNLKAVQVQSMERPELRVVKLVASHGKKTKDAQIVEQQLVASVDGWISSSDHRIDSLMTCALWRLNQFRRFRSTVEQHKRNNDVMVEALHLLRGKPTSLLTEDLIKSLHQTMASGLIEKKYAQAGEYRLHPVGVDLETHFPAPSNVPRAMENFIRRYQEMEWAEAHPIVLASWAATQFVRIHPFSNFNGRMSRLILNMVLRSYGFPFWLALKSNKKDRARYFYALRRGELDSGRAMATLVSMQVNETFARFNEQLAMIGTEPLNPHAELPLWQDLDDAALLKLRWPINSVSDARDNYIAACQEAGVQPEPIDDSPAADERLKLPSSPQNAEASSA